MVKDLNDLITNYNNWALNVGEMRLMNLTTGYRWCAKGIGYENKALKLEEYKTFFDRSELNKEWLKRYNEPDLKARKPYVWLQAEIDQIYSFHKCFAMRHQTRLQYYRHDLSQKMKRNKGSLAQAQSLLEFKAGISENA